MAVTNTRMITRMRSVRIVYSVVYNRTSVEVGEHRDGGRGEGYSQHATADVQAVEAVVHTGYAAAAG